MTFRRDRVTTRTMRKKVKLTHYRRLTHDGHIRNDEGPGLLLPRRQLADSVITGKENDVDPQNWNADL
jgi:hypothetical protein